MRIVIIANTVGVIYKFRYELVKKLIDQGHEVLLIAQNDFEDEYLSRLLRLDLEYKEIKMSKRGKNFIKELKLIKDYYKSLKEFDPDKILTFTIKPNIYIGLISKLLKAKQIATITGLGSCFYNNFCTKQIIVFMNKISMSKVEKLFFQNQENLEIYLKYKIVKKEDTILVNGSGVNLKRFYPMEKTKPTSQLVFLFIGRLMDEKGIKEYLEAAKVVKQEGDDVVFQILGDYYEEKWQEQVEDYEEKGFVKYLGFSSDVMEEIRNCDCVINPSYHEGMSNVLLEAGAMGKLLLGSNISGIKEIIQPVNKDLLFEKQSVGDMVEKIKRVFKMEKSEIENKKKKQMEYIKNFFRRDLIVDEYIKIIEN